MKRDLREWLPTTLLCGLLVGVAIASNRLMSAQSISLGAQDDVAMAEERGDSRALPEMRPRRRPPQAPDAHSMPSLPIPPDLSEVPSITIPLPKLPEMAKDRRETPIETVERRCETLSVQIQQANATDDTERMDALKSELKKAVKEHFDRLETQRKKQIAILTARLESLNKVLDARSQNADQIIERRIKQLLGEHDSLDWNPQIETTENWRSEEIRTRELSRVDGLPRALDRRHAEVGREEAIANMKQDLQSLDRGIESGISAKGVERAALIEKIRAESAVANNEESNAEIDERRAILDEQRRKLEVERRERLKPRARNPEPIR